MTQDSGAVPFGYRLGWLAVKGRSPEEIAAALALRQLRAVPWREGVEAVTEDGAGQYFLTPELDGWVLVAAEDLLSEPASSATAPAELAARIAQLSRELGEVQAFATYHVIEYHHWMRASRGTLLRAYAYLGESGEVWLDEGAPTPEEQALRGGEDWTPGEQDVMALAARWSVDPSNLEGHPAGALPGLLGLREAPAAREPSVPDAAAQAPQARSFWRRLFG